MFFQSVKMTGEIFTTKILFSVEATSHLSRHVNWHYVRIWGSSNLHFVVKDSRESPKFSAFGALFRQIVFRHFLPDALWLVMHQDILQGFLMLMHCWRQIVLVSCYSSKTMLPLLHFHSAYQDSLDQQLHQT